MRQSFPRPSAAKDGRGGHPCTRAPMEGLPLFSGMGLMRVWESFGVWLWLDRNYLYRITHRLSIFNQQKKENIFTFFFVDKPCIRSGTAMKEAGITKWLTASWETIHSSRAVFHIKHTAFQAQNQGLYALLSLMQVIVLKRIYRLIHGEARP